MLDADGKHRATTHTDLVVRAKKLGVDVKVVHNASVMNAVGVCGLQLYRYGETVSIPFFTETWRPSSFYEKIQRNRALGLHTLCLLGKITVVILYGDVTCYCGTSPLYGKKEMWHFNVYHYFCEGACCYK